MARLFRLAGPNVVNTAAESLMSFVDFVVVSQLAEKAAAQAAVSSAGLSYFCVFSAGFGICMCVTTVVSQSLGAGRPRDCAVYGWQGVWLALAYGLIGLALWPLVPFFYTILGHEPLVQQMETEYTRIRLAGMGLAGVAVALGHFFNGIHRPHHNAYSVVFSAALNAVLSYALVLGKWGFPAMGVPGAAWATVIAGGVRVVWLFAAMLSGSTAREFHTRHTWRLQWEKMVRLVRVGLPAGIHSLIDVGAWTALVAGIIGQFGTFHLAASATVWRMTELSFMPAFGLGNAVTTMVGKAVGERRFDLARRRALLGLAVNLAYMGAMGVWFVAGSRQIMEFFSDEPQVIALGIELLILAAIFQVFDATAITFGCALRGAGDTLWPAVVAGIQIWGFMVAGAALFARFVPEWGARGPWLIATLFVILVGLTFAWRWHRGAWERLDVLGRGRTDAGVVETTPL